MSNLVDNEAVKLMANWLNGMSIALVAAGIIIPLINQAVGTVPLGPDSLTLLIVCCLAVAVALHLIGQRVLRGLHESHEQ